MACGEVVWIPGITRMRTRVVSINLGSPHPTKLLIQTMHLYTHGKQTPSKRGDRLLYSATPSLTWGAGKLSVRAHLRQGLAGAARGNDALWPDAAIKYFHTIAMTNFDKLGLAGDS